MIEGFAPVFDGNSKILILGSFPSVKSREEAFYYGNPRNRFWGILEERFCAPCGKTPAEKTAFLLKRKIALWDIVIRCDIEGSLDANIKNPVIADVAGLFKAAPIEKILCNGGKSYALLLKHFPNLKNIAVPLPSTSPANFKFDRAVWLSALNGVN